jgi:hypothetical protein
MAVLSSKLAAELDLTALRAVAAIFTATDIILWLLVAGMTIKKGWNWQLFYAPCLHTYQQAVAAARSGSSGGGCGGPAPPASRRASEAVLQLANDPGLAALDEGFALSEAPCAQAASLGVGPGGEEYDEKNMDGGADGGGGGSGGGGVQDV